MPHRGNLAVQIWNLTKQHYFQSENKSFPTGNINPTTADIRTHQQFTTFTKA